VSGLPRLIEFSDVTTRGPGSPCVSIHSRRSLSSGEPGLSTVVNPALSVAAALAAAASMDWTGVSPSRAVW